MRKSRNYLKTFKRERFTYVKYLMENTVINALTNNKDVTGETS
jgi:hypothetical protein